MNKTITFHKGKRCVTFSIGPSSAEEYFEWNEKNYLDACKEDYISVLMDLLKQYPVARTYLVCYLGLGVPENLMQEKLQERFDIHSFYEEKGIHFSERIEKKILVGRNEADSESAILSVGSVEPSSLQALFLGYSEGHESILIITENKSKDEILEKVCSCGFDNLIKESAGKTDILVSFLDVGNEGNNIMMHYDLVCPKFCGLKEEDIKTLRGGTGRTRKFYCQ